MNTFKIYTLGCKVNLYDSNSLKSRLISAGFSSVEKNADVSIINTCSVTKTAQKKDRQMIMKAKNENPKAKIVLMGCFVKTYRDEAEKIRGVDLLWPVGGLDALVERIFNFQSRKGPEVPTGLFGFSIFNEIQNPKNKKKLQVPGCELQETSVERSRYFIKVQDGCEQFCSYCIIPYARGGLKSALVQEVIAEIEKAVEMGFREIILSGIHLGLYGKDLILAPLQKGGREGLNADRPNLVGLLNSILKIKDLGRIRLSSIEVTEVTDKLIALMKKDRMMCRHLHIPLQSGTDKILKRMNRPYDLEYYKKKIREIRKKMPEIAITTDVIVGFPGETEKDFKETIKFIKEINFSKLHVFSFSAHEKTAASKMDGKVPAQEIKRRSEVLRKLSERLEKDYKKKFIGKRLDVVIDARSKSGKYRGKSEYYFDVEFKSLKKFLVGKIARVEEWK